MTFDRQRESSGEQKVWSAAMTHVKNRIPLDFFEVLVKEEPNCSVKCIWTRISDYWMFSVRILPLRFCVFHLLVEMMKWASIRYNIFMIIGTYSHKAAVPPIITGP